MGYYFKCPKMVWNPDLDEQKDFERLVLVRNGIA